ncbi:interleukin-31 receptor subunit alpha [Camelus ferus]|nr:interleukin-31 receptor subunit alpha [Camelus ferus]
MVQIRWVRPVLAPKSSNFKYILRFRTVNSTHWVEVNFTEREVGKEAAYNLTGLQAFTEYAVELCCVTEESRLWSDWSEEKRGITEEEGNSTWPGSVASPETSQGGWKKASEVVVEAVQCVTAMQACLTQDQLVVEWQSFTLKVDKWVVEWVPDLDSEPSLISWESVSQAKNWTIKKDKLKPFQCYNISVYPMLKDQVGEPYSIQTYVKEGGMYGQGPVGKENTGLVQPSDKAVKAYSSFSVAVAFICAASLACTKLSPSVGPMTKVENIGVKTVTITWKEIPKNKRNGFISNYTIFYQAEDGKEFSKTVNASILQYDLESLTRKTSYTVQVMASTSAGGINGTKINFKTLSIRGSQMKELNEKNHLLSDSLVFLKGIWGKLNLKEFDDSVNTEDRILKPRSASSDLIDKLVVNFETLLEEVSTEERGKGQESIWGGEENETSLISPLHSIPPAPKPALALVIFDLDL